MRYLILSQPSVDYAKAISRKIYELSRPPHVRHPDDVTLYYSGHIIHADGRVAVGFPEPGELPVHAEASSTDLPELIEPAITAIEKTKLGADILLRRGTRTSPINFLPASITNNLKTLVEMEADGWTWGSALEDAGLEIVSP